MSKVRRELLLDREVFLKVFAARGAHTEAEIAELLGVHRTTVLRALDGSQVGPALMAAMVAVLGAKGVIGLVRSVEVVEA